MRTLPRALTTAVAAAALLIPAAVLSAAASSTGAIGATGAALAPADRQAANVHGWGRVVAGDEFNYTGAANSSKWGVYDSSGHAGNGVRSPAQVRVNGTALRITGKPDGTTGGMAAKFDRRQYGRWEVRLRTNQRDPAYHPVSMLWPDSGQWPVGGEIDYAEGTADTSRMHFFLHYDTTTAQTSASRSVDTRAWHTYAVEWTATGVKGYVDGDLWFTDNNLGHLPPGPMHQALQLDWFPGDGDGSPVTSWMEVDWVRVYTTGSPSTPPPSTPPPSTPPPSGSVTIAAVGDMNPEGNTSMSGSSGKNAASIATGLESGALDAFIGLGDFQYETGTCSSLVDYWGRVWGDVKPDTYWISAPYHDWEPGRNEDLDDFMNGQCAGDTSKSAINQTRGFIPNGQPYSFDLGNWHFAMLSTALWRYDLGAAQEVTTWLDRDLAAAKAAGKHLAVAYHDPLFTSPTEDHDPFREVQPWVDVMYEHKVRLTLSGSQHNYERTCPVSNTGACVSDGMTAFNASTGGIGLRPFEGSEPSFMARRFSDTWGHLRLTLNASGSYSWSFLPVTGTSTDSGSRAAP